MAKLQLLSFEDDDIITQRIKEESNHCDVAHLYVATYGICQVILTELSPIDLDGNGRLTICANVEKQNVTPGYKNWKGTFNVSTYDLPRCADSRKSAINKTGWDDDTFRVSIGPTPFDEITVQLP